MLYFAPETILPIGSALAGVVGVIFMFGRRILAAARRVARRVSRRE